MVQGRESDVQWNVSYFMDNGIEGRVVGLGLGLWRVWWWMDWIERCLLLFFSPNPRRKYY